MLTVRRDWTTHVGFETVYLKIPRCPLSFSKKGELSSEAPRIFMIRYGFGNSSKAEMCIS